MEREIPDPVPAETVTLWGREWPRAAIDASEVGVTLCLSDEALQEIESIMRESAIAAHRARHSGVLLFR